MMSIDSLIGCVLTEVIEGSYGSKPVKDEPVSIEVREKNVQKLHPIDYRLEFIQYPDGSCGLVE